MLDDFTRKVPSSEWSDGDETTIHFPDLPLYLAKYQNPKEADAMTKIQSDLDETKIILVRIFPSYVDLLFYLILHM